MKFYYTNALKNPFALFDVEHFLMKHSMRHIRISQANHAPYGAHPCWRLSFWAAHEM
jgi:hypothetical protein